MSLLKLDNVDVSYGAIRALTGVSLEVGQGSIVSLIGANGAGKSTTLRTISGLLKPTQGSISYDGADIKGLAPHMIVRRGLAHSPEGRGVFANLSVDENLAMGAYIRNERTEAQAIAADRERMFTLFPRLKERLQQAAGTLSGGEQQMLAMARALMGRPKLLLLDEPSLGLAPQVVQTIFAIIKEINAAGTTLLLVEQNAHMALQVSHYAYVLEVGRIVMADEAKSLARSDAVRKAYLGGH